MQVVFAGKKKKTGGLIRCSSENSGSGQSFTYMRKFKSDNREAAGGEQSNKKMLRKGRSESFALNPQLSTCDTDSFVEIIIC